MSGKQEKKRRYNLKLEYIDDFYRWIKAEPPMWKFWIWRKWKQRRPMWDDSKVPRWGWEKW